MTTRRRVSSYPTYLLKAVPDSDRRRLSGDASDQNVSVSDVVRRLLCGRYELDCPPESYRYDASRDTGAKTILLRLQPRLHKRLVRESARTGRSIRRIILETITSHYSKGEPS